MLPVEFSSVITQGLAEQPGLKQKLSNQFGVCLATVQRWADNKSHPVERAQYMIAEYVERNSATYRQNILACLREEFPGKNIVCIPNEDHPEEIVVELDAINNGLTGLAVAVIWDSAAHYHNQMTEVYQVEDGRLMLYVSKDGRGTVHQPMTGESQTIEPGTLHWVEAAGVCVRVESTPPWTPEDHILGSKEDY